MDWWESWWRRLDTGNCGAVGDVDRRVLQIRAAAEVGKLGFITCVWGCFGSLGLLHRLNAMDVVDVEGLDDCAEGEGQNTWKRTTRDI